MRNRLLMAVSAVALMISGAAFAGETATENTQNQPATQSTEQSSTGTTSAQEGTTGETAAGTAQSTEEGSSDTSAETTAGGASATETMVEEDARFGSYADTSESFSGQIAGGYMAEELIGKSLVDASGESVGEVHDLLIGENDQIEKVLVDVGGFLGLGERRVALDIDELQVSEGGDFVTTKTQEELEQMPEFDKAESEWSVVPRN